VKLRLQTPTLALVLIFTAVAGYGGEFQALVDSFSSTTTVAGTHHAKTTNPDSTSINFWDPGFEGQAAVAVGLSNAHMSGADVYGTFTSRALMVTVPPPRRACRSTTKMVCMFFLTAWSFCSTRKERIKSRSVSERKSNRR
jgi:hypothetical protein